MNSQKETLEWVKTILAPRKLSPVEEIVLDRALSGKLYREIAKETGYDSGYIKDIGSQLWLALSHELNREINKRNLAFMLRDFPQEESRNFNKKTQRKTRLAELDFPGRPLPFKSPFYIERLPIETLAINTLHQAGSLIRLKAPQRMGKTSLIYRLFGIAHQHEMQTVLVNVQQAEPAMFKDLDQFLQWICWVISQQLNLAPKFDDYWFEGAGSKMSCTVYMQEYCLNAVDTPVVIAFDKVHTLFDYPDLASHFFLMLRHWYEQARTPGNWQKLRLILAYSTELSLSIQTHQSPFNVGLPVNLSPFTRPQISELRQRYKLEQVGIETTSILEPLLDLVGGHPYLLQLAFYWLSLGYLSLEQLLAEAPTPKGIYGEYLDQLWIMLAQDAGLEQAFYQVLSSSEPIFLDTQTAHRLEGLGLVQLQGMMASPTCELYRNYFLMH
ncbi:MAG: AAA-like domain-containing protein [Coleofasciculus sp. G3-WIS-01]|uniref:AAA-like domain-containing protein n=1 Tax=Coleofasciculus sp. G3-WIS-01 TaxID=3069528 RepID=UPI0032F41312